MAKGRGEKSPKKKAAPSSLARPEKAKSSAKQGRAKASASRSKAPAKRKAVAKPSGARSKAPPKHGKRPPRSPRASPPKASPRAASLGSEAPLSLFPISTLPGANSDWEAGPTLPEELVLRWVQRGEELLGLLAEHGCAAHEYRADLREGRVVWLAPSGNVSAEASALVLCSWSPITRSIAMGWADPLVRAAAILRIEGVPSERDRIDEETAWRIAMHAAEVSGADYLHRIPTPHAWYFLALRGLGFAPEEPSFTPGTPVGLVMKGLEEIRGAIVSRAEPSEVIRERLDGMSTVLLEQAHYAYRTTDWVARLERTGRSLALLAKRVVSPSFEHVAAGRPAFEWVAEDVATDLVAAVALLEDEWGAFA
jgi:hypothetical protein